LPFLLDWIRYELPPWRELLLKLATHPVEGKPLEEGKIVYSQSLIEGKSWRRAELTELGFLILSTNAAPEIPELEALMKNNQKPVVGLRAIHALGGIGVAAIPALTNALASTSQTNRIDIIYAIFAIERGCPSRSRDACRAACLLALTRALNDPDAAVRRQAETTLFNLDPQTLSKVLAK
jgi:HEAT repeat protein